MMTMSNAATIRLAEDIKRRDDDRAQMIAALRKIAMGSAEARRIARNVLEDIGERV
jgi:hypothetical protein